MVSIEAVIEHYIFKKVVVKLTTGAELEGYIVDIKLPVATTIAWHFLEEFKAKRYLAKFNPDWLTPLVLVWAIIMAITLQLMPLQHF